MQERPTSRTQNRQPANRAPHAPSGQRPAYRDPRQQVPQQPHQQVPGRTQAPQQQAPHRQQAPQQPVPRRQQGPGRQFVGNAHDSMGTPRSEHPQQRSQHGPGQPGQQPHVGYPPALLYGQSPVKNTPHAYPGNKPIFAGSNPYTQQQAAKTPVHPGGLIAVALVVLLAIGGLIFALTRPAPQDQAISAPAAASMPAASEAVASNGVPPKFELSVEALDTIPDSPSPTGFALAGGTAPALGADDAAAIQHALAAISETSQSDAGFVFIDLQTGKGISCNANMKFYGASTFKAPYATYICETKIEPADAGYSLGDLVPVSVVLDQDSYYGNSGDGAYTIDDLIGAAIMDSDNNAFGFLRDYFDDQGFDEWAEFLGVGEVEYDPNSWFPTYSPRTSAKLWTNIAQYLSAGTETGTWLAGLMENTNMSFIRDALIGTDATVYDKAGWCADADPNYNCTSDAGIVVIDDKGYILSVMTGQPFSEESQQLTTDLASAVLDARDALA